MEPDHVRYTNRSGRGLPVPPLSMNTLRTLTLITRLFASRSLHSNFRGERARKTMMLDYTPHLQTPRSTSTDLMTPHDTGNDIERLEAELEAVDSDERRIDVLHDLVKELMYSQPKRALSYAKKALALGASNKLRSRQAEAYLQIGSLYHHLGNQERAENNLAKARRLAEGENNRPLVAETLNVLGLVYGGMGRYRQCVEILRESLVMYREIDPSRVRTVLNNLAPAYSNLGDYASGLECLYECLPLYEAAGESILSVELHIGSIHANMQNWEEARIHTQKALDIAREEESVRGQGSALKNLATIHAELGDPEGALHLAAASLDIGRRTEHASLIVLSMQTIAACHFMCKRIDESLHWHLEALNMAHELGQAVAVGVEQLNLATIYQTMGESDKAIELASQAAAAAEAITYPELERNAHRLLSEIFEHRNDVPRAFEHFRKATALNEELLGKEMQNSISRIQMRAEMEQAARDREIFRLKSERLAMEMQHKTKELTSLAMQLVQKNEMLDELKKQIGDIARLGSGTSGGANELAPIIRQIETSRNSENEWELFEQQFRALHPEFMDDMARRCPELSPTELKVCALMKINLSSKEIANILCSSVRTVEDHRYRIRTKLGLPKGENLGSWLARVKVGDT